MADKKISALTAATTPLAGTEVLPIVQSGSTVKVTNNDLRPKQIQSNATSGVLQVVGPAAASTRVMTTPDANFTVARTDAAQSFTGDQTLGTGNLIQGTAAKGVNFTANTPAAGMTSQLLNWYEEGTFTPTYTSSGATFSYTEQYGAYTRVGNQVTFTIRIKAQASGTTTNALTLGALPFTPASGGSLNYSACTVTSQTAAAAGAVAFTNPSSTTITIRSSPGVDATPAFFSLDAAALWVLVSGSYFV